MNVCLSYNFYKLIKQSSISLFSGCTPVCVLATSLPFLLHTSSQLSLTKFAIIPLDKLRVFSSTTSEQTSKLSMKSTTTTQFQPLQDLPSIFCPSALPPAGLSTREITHPWFSSPPGNWRLTRSSPSGGASIVITCHLTEMWRTPTTTLVISDVAARGIHVTKWTRSEHVTR